MIVATLAGVFVKGVRVACRWPSQRAQHSLNSFLPWPRVAPNHRLHLPFHGCAASPQVISGMFTVPYFMSLECEHLVRGMLSKVQCVAFLGVCSCVPVPGACA